MCLLDGLGIDELQVEHVLDMPVVGFVTVDIVAEVVDVCILELLTLSHSQHDGSVSRREELALAIQQLQGIPLAWVMRGGDDDATVGTQRPDSQLGRRCRGQSDVDDVEADTHEGATDDAINHHTRHAGVTSHDDGRTVVVEVGMLPYPAIATDKLGIGRRELDDIQGVEGIACGTAYGSAYSRYGLDKCHTSNS